MKSSRINPASRCSKNERLFIELKSKWLCKFSAGGAISWLVAETFRMQRQGDVHLLLQCGCHCDRKARSAHLFQSESIFTVCRIFIQIDSINHLLVYCQRLVFLPTHFQLYLHLNSTWLQSFELIWSPKVLELMVICKNLEDFHRKSRNNDPN